MLTIGTMIRDEEAFGFFDARALGFAPRSGGASTTLPSPFIVTAASA
jgi:hypothetical protein